MCLCFLSLPDFRLSRLFVYEAEFFFFQALSEKYGSPLKRKRASELRYGSDRLSHTTTVI